MNVQNLTHPQDIFKTIYPTENSTKLHLEDNRYFSLDWQEVDDALSLKDGFEKKHPIVKNGLAELKKTDFVKGFHQRLDEQLTEILGKNSELIPHTYRQLSVIYNLFSLNPFNDELSKQMAMAKTLRILSHWFIDDLIDEQKERVNDKEKYGELVTTLFLNPLHKISNSDCPSLFKGIPLSEDEIFLKKRELKQYATIKNLDQRITLAMTMFSKSLEIITNLFGQPNVLNGFKQTSKEMLDSFKMKICLDTLHTSAHTYLQNRVFSAGTLPNVKIQYLWSCLEEDVNIKKFNNFITDSRYAHTIRDIEECATLYIGLCNDIIDTVRDQYDDTATATVIFGEYSKPHQNSRSLKNKSMLGSKFKSAEWIYNGFINTKKHSLYLYAKLKNQLELLHAENKDYQKFVEIIAKSNLQEMYGINTYVFYHERYRDGANLFRIFNADHYSEDLKRVKFYKRYNELVKKILN